MVDIKYKLTDMLTSNTLNQIWLPEDEFDTVVGNNFTVYSVRNALLQEMPLYRHVRLGSMDNGSKTLIYSTDRGSTYDLSLNPNYRKFYFDNGLRPDTVFGCIWNFLFRPTEDLFEPIAHLYSMLRNPKTLKIGIHLRLGDRYLVGRQPLTDREVQHYVSTYCKCAFDIERWALTDEYERAIWFVISDTPRVRDAIVKKFPTRALTYEGGTVQHLLYAGQKGAYDAAREQWLFGMMDYYVLSSQSSFSKTASARGMKWNNVFEMNQDTPTSRDCSLEAATPYSVLADTWIRF